MKNVLTILRDWIGLAPRAETPTGPFLSSDPRVLEILGGSLDSTGIYVTEQSARSVAAVWACVRLIAGGVSLLPIQISRDVNGQYLPTTDRDDLWWLLNEEPSIAWTAASFWEFVTQSMLLHGDGFAEIIRRNPSSPVIRELRPHHPNRVELAESDEFGILYRITRRDGSTYIRTSADMLHFAGPGFDGLRSPSAIKTYASRSIGGAIATEEFSKKFFANGALQKHVIKSPVKMHPDAAERLRDQWATRYSGLDNAYRPIVLTEGLDVKELSLNAEDSQLIESRRFQVIDIARAFGVPPILIQESEKTSSWGSGVEQIIIAFVRFTLAPHLERFRDEMNRKLFRRSGRVLNFDTEALTQPDAKVFGDLLRQLVGGSNGPGILTPNEARAALRRAPMPDGDKRFEPNASTAGQSGAADTAKEDTSNDDPTQDPGKV